MHLSSPQNASCNQTLFLSRDTSLLRSKYIKNSKGLKQKLYTPVISKTQSQIIFNSLIKNQQRFDTSKDENDTQDPYIKSINKVLNQIQDQSSPGTTNFTQQWILQKVIEKKKRHLFKKWSRYSQLQSKHKSLIKSNCFKHMLAVFRQVKQSKYQQIKHLKHIISIKGFKITSCSFNSWKLRSNLLEMEEQVQLLENDLIIEKSKTILQTVFSKLNIQQEHKMKQSFLSALIKRDKCIQNILQSLKSISMRRVFQQLQRLRRTREKHSFALKQIRLLIKCNINMSLSEAFINIKIQPRAQEYLLDKQNRLSQANSNLILNNIQNLGIHLQVQKPKQQLKQKLKPTKEDYPEMRSLQRVVLSMPSIQQVLPMVLSQNKNSSSNLYKTKQKLHSDEKSGQKEVIFEDDEQTFQERNPLYYNQQHVVSTTAAINDDSLLKFSPIRDHNKRESYVAKLNISNINKNNNTEIMDEEDHQILTRLMQKYQRDFNHLHQNMHHNYQSNNSSTTLNLNSHDTLNLIGGGGSTSHKRLNSMIYKDRNNYLTERIEQSVLQLKSKIILEDDEISKTQNDEEENITNDDKLSFTSPTSIRIININGLRKNSEIFKDQRNPSISMSKIEDDIQNQSQINLELQDFQNEEDADGDTQHKKDFSFSIEKEKDQFYFSVCNERMSKKKKEGSSRNYYSKQMIMSKQKREEIALNELNNVLNQQYTQIPPLTCGNNCNLRSSDALKQGGTHGQYTQQLEQETANFNRGDWFAKSPMGSTFRQLQRPMTRSSNNAKSDAQSKQNNLQNTSSPQQDNSQKKLSMIYSPEEFQQSQNLSRLSNNLEKSNIKGLELEQQDNNSPIQMQSHFANFSQEFISPQRNGMKHQLGATTTQGKKNNQLIGNQLNHNTSQLLNTSGATTLAQQSAFEQFRSRLHDTLRNIDLLQNNKHIQSEQQNNLLTTIYKPQSQNRRPNSRMHRKQKSAFDVVNQKGYQSNQVSNKKTKVKSCHHQASLSPSQYNNAEHLQKRNVIWQQDHRHRESVNLDMADPVEIESVQNSIQNLAFVRQSLSRLSKQFPSFKENIDPQQMIEEEDADVTLRKSPENYNQETSSVQQSSRQINMAPDEECEYLKMEAQSYYDSKNIPVFQLELRKNETDHLRESMNDANALQNFMLLTQQSTQSNYFQKRTMSHNDLVQLGTVTYQQPGYMSQRSMSIQQVDPPINYSTQNKFIDAFRQYEADKVRTRSVCGSIQESLHKQCNTVYPAHQLSQSQNQYSNFFSQFQSINKNNTSYSQVAQPCFDDNNQDIYSIQNEENGNIMDGEIKEREAEEEESFIQNNNEGRNIPVHSQGQYNTCQPDPAKQHGLLLQIYEEQELKQQSNTKTSINSNERKKNKMSMSSSNSRKQPKEVVITLEMGQFKTIGTKNNQKIPSEYSIKSNQTINNESNNKIKEQTKKIVSSSFKKQAKNGVKQKESSNNLPLTNRIKQKAMPSVTSLQNMSRTRKTII